MIELDKIYSDLDFQSGELFSALDSPSEIHKEVWLEKGEWLFAAKRAGVDKVFFINNNPIVVFAKCVDCQTEKSKAFNRIWSLGRPRLLFLASPGQITVYDLAQKPITHSDYDKNKLQTLATLHDIEKIAQNLQDFHRNNIESGKIFENGRFGDLKNRADQSLIRDLKTVRRELIQAGLSGIKEKYAHALIGRSIFIRYLEDRQILNEEYFRKVARQTAGWTDILKNESDYMERDFSEIKPFYPRILINKDFTYQLFKSLARDFNGDMFPDVDNEEKAVKQKHLEIVQELLYGNAGIQKKLFFYSYRFDIVPLDLISSIYEEFYHSSTQKGEKKSRARQDGAFYTPPVLAEFVLSQILTIDKLRKNPRVLDPACGSGIFLVEAFRRIVRYNHTKKKTPLSFNELKSILKSQIAGIEVNMEAARITAFSLYLALLNYLNPPSILKQVKLKNKLPKLIATNRSSQNNYHCIWIGNAFDVKSIQSNSLWIERFGNQSADVIVGNPPWGAPGNKADIEAKARERIMLDWCHNNNKPIGDKEPSQAFLWRALDFLKEGGKSGMLVSGGILFKHASTTQAFRKQWMDNVRLEGVYNFTHVRNYFFKGAISPFIFITFSKGKQKKFPVTYWSAKKVATLRETQAILFSKYDIHVLHNKDLSSNKLWKCYWFGRYNDWKLIQNLNNLGNLGTIINKHISARGFQKGNQSKRADWLLDYKELPVDKLEKHTKIKKNMLIDPPKIVEARGNKEIYSGSRILIKRGIQQQSEPKGQIVSNFTQETFCFRNSVHCIKLLNNKNDNYLLIQGILWSSITRYYFFNTTSNWGVWHDEIHMEEIFDFPFNEMWERSHNKAVNKVINIVKKIRNYLPQEQNIICPDGVLENEIELIRSNLNVNLDNAVFELYGMNEEQKDLVRDFCEVTIPFSYKPFDSIGSMPAVYNDEFSWIDIYIKIFARCWNAYLSNNQEIRAEVHVGENENMLAIEFFPADKTDRWNLKPKSDSWGYILEQIGNALPQSIGTSQIVLDGLAHIISNNGIIIIKRNEKRFWTRSLSREDADTTLYKAMKKEENYFNG